MRARVLVVEDEKYELESRIMCLTDLSEEDKALYGITDGLIVEGAESEDEARSRIKHSEDKSKPYDVVLLDLNLPRQSDSEIKAPEVGFELLEFIRQRPNKPKVIVVSAWSNFQYVQKSMRYGAIDFVEKNYDDAFLRNRFCTCWESVVREKAYRILIESPAVLIPGMTNAFERRLGSRFTDLAASVTNLPDVMAREMGNELEEGLIAKFRSGMTNLINSATRNWRCTTDSLYVEHELDSQVIPILEITNNIKRNLEPCFIARKVKLDWIQKFEAFVLTFGNEVQTVIWELFSGGLREREESPEDMATMTMAIEDNDQIVKITIKDDLARIDMELIEKINKAEYIPPEGRFTRSWGLSIAQMIALNGAGKLIIDPNEYGNTITYEIPKGT